MCGISGIFRWKGTKALSAIKSMSDVIRHRGPDDEGFAFFSLSGSQSPQLFGGEDSPAELFTSRAPYSPKRKFKEATDGFHLAFGHRRLSILDLSVLGHQPMCDRSERYWITYNGEVYNHLELRKELENHGHTFDTHTDTEVVLQAYVEWGVDCLHRFNGMFAFLIFDSKEQVLFGARDRFAIKPFYYWESPHGFTAFASEIKQFTTLPGWEARLNGSAAYDFLNWGITNHTSGTCFDGVMSLPGGSCFREKLDVDKPLKVRPRRWYTLEEKPFSGTLEDAAIEFKTLLKDAVNIRCRADVSLGSCLSGGLDSSSIVCLVHEILKEKGNAPPQMTFSACSRYKPFDESEYISQVIDATAVNPFYTYPDLDHLLEKLDILSWHQDEPFGSTSIFAQWEVFSLVKQQGVKVMLDGQGADEQLAGYRGFLAVHLEDLVRAGRYTALWRELKACKEVHHIPFPSRLLLDRLLPDWLGQPLRRVINKTTTDASWIDSTLLGITPRDPHKCEKAFEGELKNLSYSQITRTSIPMLLHYEDRDSMAHSIEARTPFLDYRLVEFLLSLPSEYKLENGITKRVLRQGLQGVLPEGIRSRTSKLGFATPEEVWVKQNPALFKELIRNSIKASQGILNRKAINLADRIVEGKIPYSFLLWRMISFGKWIERFSVKH